MNVSVEDSFPKRFKAYIDERFPLKSFLPLIILFTVSLDFLGQYNFRETTLFLDIKLIGGICLIVLIFFHLRLFDEFKDYSLDVQMHPERLISRGVISLLEIRKVTWIVISAEVLIAYLLGVDTLIRYSMVLLFSVLMLKEFFIGDLLNRDMVVYAITHQLIILFLGWLAYGLHHAEIYPGRPELPWLAMSVLCASFAFELTRKVHGENDQHLADSTYSGYFGWQILTIIVSTLMVVSAFFQELVYRTLELPQVFWIISTSVTISIVIFLFIIGFSMKTKRDKYFNFGPAIVMLSMYLSYAMAIISKKGF